MNGVRLMIEEQRSIARPNNTKAIVCGLPDDWHLHLRDGDALQSVVLATALQFGRAIVMPNLKPPVTTVSMALEYRQRILDALNHVITKTVQLIDPQLTQPKRRALQAQRDHQHRISIE